MLNDIPTERVTSIVILGREVAAVGGCDRCVRLYDLGGKTAVQTLEEATDAVTWLGWDSDSCLLMTASLDGKIRTYDLRKGLVTTDSLPGPINNAVVSEDSRLVATQHSDGTVCLLETGTGRVLNAFSSSMPSPYKLALEFSQSGAFLFTGKGDGGFRVWDIAGGAVQDEGGPLALCSDRHTDSVAVGLKDGTLELRKWES